MKNRGYLEWLPLALILILAGCEVYTPQVYYPGGGYVDNYPTYIESEPAYVYPDAGYYGGAYVAPPVVPVAPAYPYWQAPTYPHYYRAPEHRHAAKPHRPPAYQPPQYYQQHGYGATHNPRPQTRRHHGQRPPENPGYQKSYPPQNRSNSGSEDSKRSNHQSRSQSHERHNHDHSSSQ